MRPIPYDEFSFFHENQAEWGLSGPIPTVRRVSYVTPTVELSGLAWTDDDPDVILLHGGAQNAHTWDTTLLALGAPALALDLPGHGHSGPSPYGPSSIVGHAHAVVAALDQLPPRPRLLVGMSLGGLTSVLVARDRPALVHTLVLVDITPGITPAKAKHITDFVNGPKTFEHFDELLERTKAFNPTRSESSLRRGILHNARQLENGTWVWRHQQHGPASLSAPPVDDLWEVLEHLPMPITLARGQASGSVVTDEDVAALHARCTSVTVREFPNAGHSIQGDAPVALAALLRDCL
jgi:pimeloyl-ACP methyl ester carboxylesterase